MIQRFEAYGNGIPHGLSGPTLHSPGIPYIEHMKTVVRAAIPVSPDTATRFASLSEEQKRVIRMRVAIEIGRLQKRKSRTESVAEFRAATASVGNQTRRKGLTLTKLKRTIDGGP